MITQLRNKEAGFSLLELSVAVGVAAIVASAGIVATTAFMNDSAEKRDSYLTNAERSVLDAESSSLALGLKPLIAAPADMQTTATTDSSATINWSTPDTKDPIESYTIIINGETVATLNGNATSYTFENLEPSTTYNIIVRATNINGSEDSVFTLTTPKASLLNFAYNNEVDNMLTFSTAETSQSFTPNKTYSDVTYSVTSGELPAGLSLNSNTGEITGPSDWGFNSGLLTSPGGSNAYSTGLFKLGEGYLHLSRFDTDNITAQTQYYTYYASNVVYEILDKNMNHVKTITFNSTAQNVHRGIVEATDGSMIAALSLEPGSHSIDGTNLTVSQKSTSILKISPEGNVSILRTMSGETQTTHFHYYDDNNIYIAGEFKGTLSYPGLGSITVSDSGSSVPQTDYFVIKINSNGEGEWIRKAGSNYSVITSLNFGFGPVPFITGGTDYMYSSGLNSDGDLYISGNFSGVGYFGSITLNQPYNILTHFYATIDASGNWQSVKVLDTEPGDDFELTKIQWVTHMFDNGDVLTTKNARLTSSGSTVWQNTLPEGSFLKVEGNSIFWSGILNTANDGSTVAIDGNTISTQEAKALYMYRTNAATGEVEWVSKVFEGDASLGNINTSIIEGSKIILSSSLFVMPDTSGVVKINGTTFTANDSSLIVGQLDLNTGDLSPGVISFDETLTIMVTDSTDTIEYQLRLKSD